MQSWRPLAAWEKARTTYLSQEVAMGFEFETNSPILLMIFFEKSPRHFIPNISRVEARCRRFDGIIGSFPQKLSDIFMRDLCYNEWIADICEAIAFHCFDTVAPGGKLAQYDGPSDDVGPSDNTNPSDTLFQASAIDDGGPFKQIALPVKRVERRE
ncbi:hypothetical protein V8E54_008070 [Elaphomyces granulatus]